MQDSQLIMNRLNELSVYITVCFNDINSRLGGIDARLGVVDSRLDGIDSRLDDTDMQMNNLRSDLKEMEARLIADMELREFGLNQEIDSVYKLALENHDNIEILLTYKDKILNASAAIYKIPVIEERQENLELVVSSHSSALRDLRTAVMT